MNKFIFFLFALASSFILMSAGTTTSTVISDADILNASKHLYDLERVNYEPKYIAPVQAALCAASAPSSSDLHAGKYINVYVNSTGFAEMTTKKKPVFPEGTMIMKEKMSADSAKGYKPAELFTVMIKREKGFNPTCGDWEFATLDVKTSKIERGKTATCMNCHIKYTATDFIKRDYLSLKYTKTLK